MNSDQRSEASSQFPSPLSESRLRRGISTLRGAYILGGSPCSGKSTVATRLAAEFGLRYYKVDDQEKAHARRVDPTRHPIMHAYARMSWEEIWMRPPAFQAEEEFAYYRERLEMIVEDLCELDPQGDPLVLENAAYFPELLHDCGVGPERVVFIVPTRAFQLHHYSRRPWINQLIKDCKDPRAAFANWMERDQLFGQEVLRQAESLGYRSIIVGGTLGVDKIAAQVKKLIGLY